MSREDEEEEEDVIPIVPGGQGPWFAALIFNTSQKCKKHTHIVAHTYPHLAVDIYNRNFRPGSENFWAIILKIGPFDSWRDCVSFTHLWTEGTRGRVRRIEKGLELYLTYKDRYNLSLWGQAQTKEGIIKEFLENRFTHSSRQKRMREEEEEEAKVEDKKVGTNVLDSWNMSRADSVGSVVGATLKWSSKKIKS